MREKTKGFIKKSIVSILVIAMFVTGNSIVPKTAEAADSYEDAIQYEDRTAEFYSLWKKGEAKAPEKAGYVFGGWYEKNGENTYKAIGEEEAQTIVGDADNIRKEGICAKFVPAYVLSVKAQVDAETTGANDGKKACLRVMSSVDDMSYQLVGFQILLNNRINVGEQFNNGEPLETTKVYDGIVVTEEEKEKTLYAEDIFGRTSDYLSVWRLNDIIDANDKKIIYVRPYWKTCDGTTVEGLAKYIHVEDSYNNYISVPVNLYQNKDVAAGMLQMSYDSELFTVHDVEYGKVFKEMEYNSNTSGVVSLVGNAAIDESGAEVVKANGLYANVRFSLTEKGKEQYQGAGNGRFLNFAVANEEFTNWNEDMIKIDSWDVKY